MKSLIAGTVLLGAASLSKGNRGNLGETPDHRGWDESAIKAREHYTHANNYLFTAPVVKLKFHPDSPKNLFRLSNSFKMSQRGDLRIYGLYRYADYEGGYPKWHLILRAPEDQFVYV